MMEATKLYIGNISYKIDYKTIANFFAKFGEIVEIMLIPNPKTHTHKGYGFISFASAAQAQQALSADGQELLGRKLKISLAKSS